MINLPPYSKTIAAASGSAQILNSAAALRFPNEPPPMSEIPAMRRAMSGALRSASAMLVNGPVGTNHTPSVARQVSIMKPTASSESAGPEGSGKSAPSRPLLP